MNAIDYIAIVVVIVLLGLICLRMRRRASKGTDEFLVGGRELPWWLAGISIVSTGINSSTPLASGRKIRNDGIGGQWFEWQSIIFSAINIIWFARLYRRSGITTPIELYAVRYGSKPASTARVLDVGSLAIFNSVIWTATGLIGFRKIASLLFGLPPEFSIGGFAVPSELVLIGVGVILGLLFSMLAGVWGVVWTDVFEFILCLGTSYLLFFLVFADIGWSSGLRDRIDSLGASGEHLLHMLPEFGPAMIVLFILQPLMSQGQWNPGLQRFLAVKDEKEVLHTAYFSGLISFVVRPWPFLMIGLIGIFMVSDAQLLAQFPPISSPNGQLVPDYEMTFPALALAHLPHGILGLLMAGFFVSFAGSLASNVHSNAALFVNDLYRPFLITHASSRHYVWATRLYMVAMTLAAVGVSMWVDNILSLIVVAMTINNASGFVKAARFVWWRVNGYAELSATIVGLLTVLSLYSPFGYPLVLWIGKMLGQQSNDAYYAIPIIIQVIATTIAAAVAMLVTGPESMETLKEFYRRVRPYGWWGPVRRELGMTNASREPIGLMWASSAAYLGYVFGGIFAMIGLLFAMWVLMFVSLAICIVAGWFLYATMDRLVANESASPLETTSSPTTG